MAWNHGFRGEESRAAQTALDGGIVRWTPASAVRVRWSEREENDVGLGGERDYSRGSHVRGQLKDVLWKTLEEKF